MICGDFDDFTIWECIKLAFGARLFIEHDGTKMQRAQVSFRPPDWVGGVIRRYKVNEN